MSSSVISIPGDLLLIIAGFLLAAEEQNKLPFRCSRDWRNFLNTKKEYLQWRKNCQIVFLDTVCSDKLRKSSKFREQIMKMIVNPVEQLDLYFSYSKQEILNLSTLPALNKIKIHNCIIEEYPTYCHDFTLEFCRINHLPSRYPIRNLTMSNCQIGSAKDGNIDLSCLNIQESASFSSTNLQNYHLLKNLRSVSISSCPSITDVSCFKNVPTLHFYGCANITDVISLGNVHELELSYCQGVKDVSALERVYRLNLSQSGGFTNISSLGNVHSLSLAWCTQIVDVSALENVRELHLNGFRGTDLSGLENVEKLFLPDSLSVCDISKLTKVKELDIDRCPLITHFDGLNSLRNLTIGIDDEDDGRRSPFSIESGMETISNLTALRVFAVVFEGDRLNQHSLSFHHLQNLQHLTLYNCVFSQIPEGIFPRLQSLHIIGGTITTMKGNLPSSLKELFLSDCATLTELQLSSSVSATNSGGVEFPIYMAEIARCSALTEVIVNRKVSRMKISSCERLTRLTAMKDIGYLKTEGGPKVKIFPRSGVVIGTVVNLSKAAYLSKLFPDDGF
jgi:hypothetical protein